MSVVRIPWLACVLAVVAMAGCSRAPDLTPLDNSGGAVTARHISGDPPLDPDDAAWQKAVPKEIAVYPQTSVPLPGQASVAPDGKSAVSVRALYNSKELALRLEWNDPHADTAVDVEHFADGAALQWPARYGRGVSLPYVGMGNPGQPAVLWFWRADAITQTLAAEGFGSATLQSPDGVQAQAAWKDGKWTVVYKRSLSFAGVPGINLQPDALALAPFALATWDGAATQRDGNKRLSGWLVLYFEDSDVDTAYLGQLAASAAPGDPVAGKRLMAEKGCSGCHTYPDNPAQPAVGPVLTYAGGIHHSDYLLESLLEPSKVVVPGKGYSTMQDGKPTSLMPPLQGSDQERTDLVAFLRTLR